MQKISSYLYPNRVQLLADLASFNVEYTNVYQRNVKIYNGIDNTIEFDIKNADQKRLDLATFTSIIMHVMDSSGKALSTSPYEVTPTTVKGIASVIIPKDDLVSLEPQYLQFSVVGVKDGADVILYADTRFGAMGKMELINNAIPWTDRRVRVYNSFVGEIDFTGSVIYHTSAIPAKFYEAQATQMMQFSIEMLGFVGSIWIKGTRDSSISVDSFKHSDTLLIEKYIDANSTTLVWADVPVNEFNYFRVYYEANDPLRPIGSIVRVLVS